MKKKILSIFVILFAAILLVSCKKDPKPEPEPEDDGITITFNVTLPANTPAGDSIYVAGNFEALGLPNWQPGEEALKLTRTGNSAKFVLELDELPEGGHALEFKFTRGDWANVEKDADGEEMDNRELNLTASGTHDFVVANWADLLEDEGPEGVTAAEAHAALSVIKLPGKVTDNLDLPATVGDVDVIWTSAHAGVVSAAGVVTQSVKNTAALLTAKVVVADGEDLTRDFWVTVYGSEVDLDATYSSAYSEIITLNPLMSTGSSDSDVYSNLTGALYSGDYDWEHAIAEGYADYPGDFSKIKSDRNPEGTVDMPSIKYKRTLSMAAAYPYAVNKKTDNSVEGSFGQVLIGDDAKETLDTEWIIKLRNDLVFADDTVINVDTFEYSFQQYLNPKLANARANYLYNKNYVALVNAEDYFNEVDGVTWEDVGFEKIDDLTFKITLVEAVTQYELMGSLGIINLVHPASFEAGFRENGTENTYGSVENPLVSYGPFTLANDWDDTGVFTFTRNEKYFAAWDIPFKKLNGPIIKDQTAIINEFKANKLDVAGVGGEFWEEFFEHPNLYISPTNSFYRLAISMERPEGRSNPIMGYKDFRHALYLATDREDFANNVQPPSQGKLGYLSNIHQVSEWATQAYAASDKFFNQLEDLGFSPETLGFDSDKAKQLFDAARAQAIADEKYTANEVVKMEFLYYDAGSNTRIANWVKAQYEKVFNVPGEDPVFEVVLNPVSSEELNAQRDAGDFDLVFTGMSGATFDATFGMGYIFSPTFSDFLVGRGHNVPTLQVEAEILNLLLLILDEDLADYDEALTVPEGMRTIKEEETHTALAALEAYDADALVEGEVPEGMRTEEQETTFAALDAKTAYDADEDLSHTMRTPSDQAFYDAVKDTDGVFTGDFDDLFNLYMSTPRLDTDYEGQEEDLTAILAGLERALLDQMIAVPLFSSTSAAVYQNDVVRLAHAYHLFLGWGGMSYMYKTK